MENVLVTGGAGFLGFHVVDSLIEDYTVIALGALGRGFAENVNSGTKLIRGSIQDTELVGEFYYPINKEE